MYYTGEKTYVARVSQWHKYYGNVPCAVIPSEGVVSVPYGSGEHREKSYEVLVCNDPGILFWSDGSGGSVPPLAVGVGNKTGEEMYIARTRSGSRITGKKYRGKKLSLPKSFIGPMLGKVHPSHHTMYLPYNGDEYFIEHYEVLCAYLPPIVKHYFINQYSWEFARDGNVPDGAFPTGVTETGEVTYIARGKHMGEKVPGFVIPSEKYCVIPWGSADHKKTGYEVLVVDNPEGFKWELASNGELPNNAVYSSFGVEGIGRTITGCDLSVAKTWNGIEMRIPRRADKKMQLGGKVACSHHCLYVPYKGLEYIYREYEALVALASPSALQELCRYTILYCTNAVPGRISSLPLPDRLKQYCQLRRNET